MSAPLLHLAASGFEAIFYLIVFVIWVAAQVGSAKRKQARSAAEPTAEEPPPVPRRNAAPGTPPVLREATTPVDQEIRDLFERMTGVPAPPPSSPPVLRSSPPPQPPRQPHAKRVEGPRRQAARHASPQPRRAIEQPPPLRQALEPVPVEAPAMPAVVTEMQSNRISMKSLNIQLPKVRLPTFLTRSAVSPQSSGAGRANRMAFLKERGILREVMLARAVLDPPKGLE